MRTPTTFFMVSARKVSLAVVAVAVALAPSALSATAVAAQEQREVRRTFSAQQGTQVDLENLAGRVVVEGKSGGDIELIATVNAESGSEADAATLLDLLEIEFQERNGRVDVRVGYPTDRYTEYRYPQSGRGRNNTQTTYRGERVKVTSGNDRDAVTLYVDFVMRVPAGVDVDIENAVGHVSASGMQGDFSGDTGSGNVTVADIVGDVSGDTGSGDIIVTGVTGDVYADTGSGDVEVTDVTGDVEADTGSGDVTLTDVRAERIDADTGSGDIEMERVTGSVNADTGSGNIIGRDIIAGARLYADSGSGDIRFSGDMSGVREINIDTSSGTVELDMSAYPGMSIQVEVGSGRITVDFPDLNTRTSRRNYFRGQVGDGSAEVSIDTGSGSVSIRGR